MFLIKKNQVSVNNPWLGHNCSQSTEDFFGKITDILLQGGKLRAFRQAKDAFEHIARYYPGDERVMQVYEVVESPKGIQFRHIPYPDTVD